MPLEFGVLKSPSFKRLLSAGYIQHSLDRQLFYFSQKLPGEPHEQLVSMVMVYVDDFLLTHDDRYDRNRILHLFTWGSQTQLGEESPITFKGNEIHLRFDAEEYVHFLQPTQKTFIESLCKQDTKGALLRSFGRQGSTRDEVRSWITPVGLRPDTPRCECFSLFELTWNKNQVP